MVYHDRLYLFIQLMYNKNDYLEKQSIFVRFLMSSLASTTPLLPRPKTPFTYVVYIIATCHCPKGILALGGKHLKTN